MNKVVKIVLWVVALLVVFSFVANYLGWFGPKILLSPEESAFSISIPQSPIVVQLGGTNYSVRALSVTREKANFEVTDLSSGEDEITGTIDSSEPADMQIRNLSQIGVGVRLIEIIRSDSVIDGKRTTTYSANAVLFSLLETTEAPVGDGETTCNDSDGGINFSVRGQIEIKNSSGNIIASDWDDCDEEFFCYGNGSAGIISPECPNGCFEGKCFAEGSENCTDSDGGWNPYEAGRVLDPARSADYTDTCTDLQTTDASDGWSPTSSGNVMREYYCGQDNYLFSIYQCPYGCADGACLQWTEGQNYTGVCRKLSGGEGYYYDYYNTKRQLGDCDYENGKGLCGDDSFVWCTQRDVGFWPFSRTYFYETCVKQYAAACGPEPGCEEGYEFVPTGICTAGEAGNYLNEGETVSYIVGDVTYEISISFIDGTSVSLEINGAATNSLGVDEAYVLPDGATITIRSIEFQGVAGGTARVGFELAEPPKAPCTDSDGGKNYDLKGSTVQNGVTEGVDQCEIHSNISNPVSNSVEVVVSCTGSNCYLSETFCSLYADSTPSGEFYSCPNGCEDGACIPGVSANATVSCKFATAGGYVTAIAYAKRENGVISTRIKTREYSCNYGVQAWSCCDTEGTRGSTFGPTDSEWVNGTEAAALSRAVSSDAGPCPIKDIGAQVTGSGDDLVLNVRASNQGFSTSGWDCRNSSLIWGNFAV